MTIEDLTGFPELAAETIIRMTQMRASVSRSPERKCWLVWAEARNGVIVTVAAAGLDAPALCRAIEELYLRWRASSGAVSA